MGRIEYEYPLFKVYYSNNSNNSNIRGNPVWGKPLTKIGQFLRVFQKFMFKAKSLVKISIAMKGGTYHHQSLIFSAVKSMLLIKLGPA